MKLIRLLRRSDRCLTAAELDELLILLGCLRRQVGWISEDVSRGRAQRAGWWQAEAGRTIADMERRLQRLPRREAEAV